MNKTSLFSGIVATAILGLGMANPVEATSSVAKTAQMSLEPVSGQSQLLQTPSSVLIAARRCYNRRVYHKGYYSRRFGIVGRRRYHPGYYTTKRVCY